MLKNYLLIALRNFRKNKFFTIVNILGLAIGISSSLVIYLIVRHEFSFDKFHLDGDRIYRVVSKMEFPDLTIRNPGIPVPTAKAAKEEVMGLGQSTFFVTANDPIVTIRTAGRDLPITFKGQEDIIYADPEFFNIFKYEWLAGSSETALNNPFQVVLTERRAQTYFPDFAVSEMIGRFVTYDDSLTCTVSGIVRDLDEITDFTFREFVSIGTVEQTALKGGMGWDSWNSINSASQFYVKLEHGTSPKEIEEKLADLRNRHRENKEKKDATQHFLQPLSDIHFNADYGVYNGRMGHKPTLYGLLAVAAFLLLLGCINFVNLSTAQATQRAKEIGIRKTMGSSREQLVSQLLGETFVVTLTATLLSVTILPLLLEVFRDFVPQGMSFSSLYHFHVWIFLGMLVIIVSFLSGLYPALVLTRYQPVTILRNQVLIDRSTSHRAWLRKILTVVQFVIAQFLIIATIVVSKQILFSLNKELGYRKDAIVYFRVPFASNSSTEDTRRFPLFQKLRQIPEITQISLAGWPPAYGGTSSSTMKVNNGKEVVETMVQVRHADTSYFGLYGMKLVAGRGLSQSDTLREYVINETYAKFLGLTPEEALNHVVERGTKIPIVGVVADFHTRSTHDPIKPHAFSSELKRSFTFHLALNANPSDWKKALEKTERAFKDLYPGDDFHATFFDDTIEGFYKTERRVSRLLNWATGLAVFISCLGLLGLVIYTTNIRIKEIGVRKVLGTTVFQIVSLLSKDFLSLVLMAFVIAAPIGWWVMNRWLEDYAYRTSLSWWVFLLSGGFMMAIALLTLGIRTIRSASANPVNSLRTE